MKIGIDIDGVLNSQYNFCIDYGTKFCNEIGKYKLENVNAIDTTGAGDSFIGAFLFKLLENEVNLEGIDKLSCDTIRDYLLFANHYAAYSTTKKGAIASYANLEEIQEYIKNR